MWNGSQKSHVIRQNGKMPEGVPVRCKGWDIRTYDYNHHEVWVRERLLDDDSPMIKLREKPYEKFTEARDALVSYLISVLRGRPTLDS